MPSRQAVPAGLPDELAHLEVVFHVLPDPLAPELVENGGDLRRDGWSGRHRSGACCQNAELAGPAFRDLGRVVGEVWVHGSLESGWSVLAPEGITRQCACRN